VDKLELIASAWTLAWGISYIITAIFTPSIGGDTNTGIAFYGILGILITISTILLQLKLQTITRVILCYLLIDVSIASIAGAVGSWSGIVTWNVPFADKALFSITMAFMNFISAVFMLILALGKQVQP